MKWNASSEDDELIIAIGVRANTLQARAFPLDVIMAITAAHLNGCPLDLAGLLAASDVDFIHDVRGIETHLDRKTGELLHCFCPRYCK